MSLSQKISLFVMTSILAACSSSPTTNTESEPQPEAMPEVAPVAVLPEERDEDRPPVVSKPIEPTDLEKLSQAVRASDWSGLERQAQKVLMRNPREVKALNALGLAAFRQSRPKAALYFFSRAMKSANASEKAQIQNNIGLVHLQMKDRKKALAAFRSSLQAQQDPLTAANLGSMYLKEGDSAKAAIAFEISESRMRGDAKMLNNQGAALAMEKKFPEAQKKYQEALKISSAQKETLFNLAVLYIEHLRKPVEGRDALQKLKFHGVPNELREATNELEKKLKSLK